MFIINKNNLLNILGNLLIFKSVTLKAKEIRFLNELMLHYNLQNISF